MQRLLDLNLRGRRALVTGSTRGLGWVTAQTLGRAGADVGIVGRSLQDSQDRVAELAQTGTNATAWAVDLADTEAVVDFAEDASKGDWDILVNCAGIAHHQPFAQVDLATWQENLAVNATAPFVLSQTLGLRMAAAGWGRIVNVSSHSGRRTKADSVAYSTSKAALQMLTQSVAVELGPQGVRCNAIAPTVFWSDMGKRLWSDPAVQERMQAGIPAKRFGEMTELADLILYLCSEAADFVNGDVIGIDGGLYSGRPVGA